MVLWDLSSNCRMIFGRGRFPSKITLSRSCKLMAVSGQKDKVEEMRLWGFDHGEPVDLWRQPMVYGSSSRRSPNTVLEFSGDSTQLISGHHSGTIRVWSTATGDCVSQIAVNPSELSTGSLCLSHSATKLAALWQKNGQSKRIIEISILDISGNTWTTLEKFDSVASGLLNNLSFPSDDRFIITSSGAQLTQHGAGLPRNHLFHAAFHPSDWVVLFQEKRNAVSRVIWLPPEYRTSPRLQLSYEGYIVAGCKSGRLFRMDIGEAS